MRSIVVQIFNTDFKRMYTECFLLGSLGTSFCEFSELKISSIMFMILRKLNFKLFDYNSIFIYFLVTSL